MTRCRPCADQVRRARPGVVDRPDRHAGDGLGLGLVGDEVVDAGERGQVDRLGRRRVDDAADAARLGEAHRVETVSSGISNCSTMQSAVSSTGSAASTSAGSRRSLAPFDDDDPVLAVRLDEDRRDAARGARHDLHLRGLDALRLEVADRRRAEEIVADAGDHRHLGAAEPRRHRLVGALAAPAEVEALAEDGLARLGEAVGEGGQVDVGAADHCNPGSFGHVPSQRDR